MVLDDARSALAYDACRGLDAHGSWLTACARLHWRPTNGVAVNSMNSPPPPAVGDWPRNGTLGKVWAFLNRDVRTFKRWRQNKPDPETDDVRLAETKNLTEPLKEPEPEVVSEVDPRQIEGLRFRREVLDWRDEFHFQVTESAAQANKTLVEQVEHELANMNFLRLRLLTKPASDVLECHIEACVRSPMRRTTQIEQAALRQRLLTWFPHRQETASIWAMWPKLEWDTRLALKFTADNRERILTILGEMILGENGLADQHRQLAIQYSAKILEM